MPRKNDNWSWSLVSSYTYAHTHAHMPIIHKYTQTHMHMMSLPIILFLFTTFINTYQLHETCISLWHFHMCRWYTLTLSALRYFYWTPSTPSAPLKVSLLLSCLSLNLDCCYEKRKCSTCVSRVWLISKTKLHLHPFSYDGIIPFLFMTE